MGVTRWLVLALALGGGCGPAAPRDAVAYLPAGAEGETIWFVERRSRREYLVVCHSRRTPPCVRTTPTSARTTEQLEAWAATGGTVVRAPRAEPTTPPDETPASPTAPATGTPDERPAEALTTGRLRFDATPWCHVSVDGTVLGQTPIVDHELSVGAHLLRCQNEELRADHTMTIEIRPGELTRRRISLPPGVGETAHP